MVSVMVAMVVWRSGGALVTIYEVNLLRAQFVLGWVIMSGFNSRCSTFILVCDH